MNGIVREELVRQLRTALDAYAKWKFDYVNSLPDEPIVERSGWVSPSSEWHIEIRTLQRWNEDGCENVQLTVDISNETLCFGTVIDYCSNGQTSVQEAIVEYVDGVPRPIE